MDTVESRTEEEPLAEAVYDGFISYSHAADDLLAPRLQAGLQRFAKPWWKRRALRIFRDESSLSANPHLWSSITDALDQSGWFVLLLSPEAAKSPWVNNEVEYWLEHKDADKIIPVLTDGDFTWFDGDLISDAAPPALKGAFSDEPRWVDLRFARTEEQLDLKNPTFSATVADIASAIRGVPKDELESEEVLQHRRTTRTAWAAGAGLLILALLAGAAAIFALDQRNDAQDQQAAAEASAAAEAEARDEADANAARAEENAGEATRNAELAAEEARTARARELGASAIEIVDSDPGLARLLSLEAIDVLGSAEDQPAFVINALWRSLQADRLAGQFETGHPGMTTIALSGDGTRIAVASFDGGVLSVYAVPEGTLLWEHSDEDAFAFGLPAFSPDGQHTAVGVWLEPQAEDEGPSSRVDVLDAADGSVVVALDYPFCATADPSAWSLDGSLLAIDGGFAGCGRDDAEGDYWIELFDTETWDPIALVDKPEPWGAFARFDESGRLFIFGVATGVTIHEPDDYTQQVATLPRAAGYGDVSPDGSLVVTYSDLLSEQSRFGLTLFDVETLLPIDALTPLPALVAQPLGTTISPDGSSVVVATNGNETYVWDAGSGRRLFALPSGPADAALMSPDGRWMYTSHPDGTVKVWDLGSKSVNSSVAGDLGTHEFVNGNSFRFGPTLGTLHALDFAAPPEDASVIRLFDLETGRLLEDTLVGRGHQPLPDGRIAFVGPSEIWMAYDPSTGESTVFVDCERNEAGDCFVPGEGGAFIDEVLLSADGPEVALRRINDDGTDTLVIIDPATGETSEDTTAEMQMVAFSGDWVLGHTDEEVVAIARGSGDELIRSYAPWRNYELSRSGERFAYKPFTEQVAVLQFDPWGIETYDLSVGLVRGLSFGPGDRVLAIADEDTLQLLDLEAGVVTVTIPLPGVSDVHWLSDDLIMIGTNNGLWATVSLNIDDLVSAAQNVPVPREFTPQECSTYSLDCAG